MPWCIGQPDRNIQVALATCSDRPAMQPTVILSSSATLRMNSAKNLIPKIKRFFGRYAPSDAVLIVNNLL